MSMKSINPATGELLASTEFANKTQIEATLARASLAAMRWKNSELAKRSNVLRQLADKLEGKKVHFANLITQEMGKRKAEALAEIEKCAANCRFYAQHAPGWLADQRVDIGAGKSMITYEPLGVLLAIMPWNFPFWQVFRYAAPGLMAGNVSVLKHAPNVHQCAQAIAELFGELDEKDLLLNLPIDVPQVADVIADPRINAVTLTGSEGAGRAVAAQAGAALKPCVVELGGSDPFIVMADADLEKAAETGVMSRFGNAGQACNAAKRFIVEEAVYDQFKTLFQQKAQALTMGDPSDDSVALAPLAREDLRDNVHRQVEDAVAKGATLVCGGNVPLQAGWFYPATLLEDIPVNAEAYSEEVFGPVAMFYRVADAEQAIELANATRFGLCGSVWTADQNKGEDMARQIVTGSVYVNGLVKSDPRLPFGGVNASGMGRELGREGLLEFVNVKTLVID